METLVAVLSAWISAQIGLPVPPPPRIIQLDPVALHELATAPDTQMERVRALYGRAERIVYLRTNWNSATPHDRSELVHELVHHFQRHHFLTYACTAARETLAYDLQLAWLREEGVPDPHALLQINEFFIVMVSVCRDADHD